MMRRLYVCLVSFIATASVASPQTVLGVDYSEPIPSPLVSAQPEYGPVLAAGVDAQGSIYLLVNSLASQQATATSYYITKLTPAGDRIVFQNPLPFQATGMAVDPAGNVYLAGSNSVEKLGTDGKTVIYTTTIAPDAVVAGIAADANGRAYITGWTATADLPATPGALQQAAPTGYTDPFVVRLNPAGSIDYATYLGGASQGVAVAIAADASGSAFVTGYAYSAEFPTTPGCYLPASGIPNFNGASFLARLSADGSSLIYSTFMDPQDGALRSVAVDSADNAVVSFAAGLWTVVERVNPQGTALVFSKRLPASWPNALAVDAAGNSFVLLSAQANFPVKNNLAICGAAGSEVLAVFDASGDLLQATYVAGSESQPAALALASGPAAYVFGLPGAAYTPTRQFAGSSSGLWFLARYSAGAKTQPVELACIGNAGSYDSTGIAGGEIVSLFGEGIGPAAGTQPQVDLRTGFPKQLANVVVTFNGAPGPLLYVQYNQINAIAPWSLPSGQTVEICVEYSGKPTNCLTRPVVDYHPGVFTVDGTYAAAFNQDGTLNTAANPAPAGSTVSIFATGLGAITPPKADGAIFGTPLPADVLPAQVYWLQSDFFIGLIVFPLDVTYAGPAPFEVAGASQIDFVVQAAPFEGSNVLYLAVGPPSVGALIEPGASRGFQVYVTQPQ